MEGRVLDVRRLMAVALIAATAACSSPAAPPSATTALPPVPTTTVTASPAASAGLRFIEDAGLETPIVPGLYASRLFEPALSMELGDGWFRRDAGGTRTLNLRREPQGEADVTFISAPDFLQCGSDAPVAKPSAATIADAISASNKLDSAEPRNVPVGGLTGIEIRLAGTGGAVPDEDVASKATAYGCVLSLGDIPYPGDSNWVLVTRDVAMLLVAVDVAGTTVLIRARSAAEPDAHFALVLEFLKHVSLG